jgi:hypothetical protein
MGGWVIMKFKVGDVFVFTGFINGDKEEFQDEIGRRQTIIDLDSFDYISIFHDTGIENKFGLDSTYGICCIIVDSDGLVEYENGVPMIWEDDV